MENKYDPQVNARLTRLLIIALLTAAVIFIFRQVWDAVFRFSQVILVFALSWLLAFLVSPVTNYLNRHPIPRPVVRLLRRRGEITWANRLDGFRIPHTLSVVLVYLVILVTLAVGLVYAVPSLVSQLVALAQAVPKLILKLPQFTDTVQRELLARGFEVDIAGLLDPAELLSRAQALSSQIVQIAVNLATSVASGLVNILLILTISLYMNLDSPRLARQLHSIVPDHYHGQVNLIGQSISRTFGAFIRGQLLVALLYGLPVGLLLGILGISLAAVVGIISGLLMLVPLVGAPIAMVLPALIALIQSPGDALWLLIVMTAWQQVLTQVLAPKLMADALGMPPLVVLLAIMVSMRIMGVWGLVFGIPAAGVVYALSVTYMKQAKIRREALPRGITDGQTGGAYRLTAMGPGCLLIPDIESQPGSLRPIADYLAVRGITCLGIDPYRSQEHAYWEDWYAVVLPALDQLWRDCNQVFVVAEGTGALLALHAASELPLSGICSIAVPLSADGRYDPQHWLAEEPFAAEGGTALQVQVLPTRARVAISHLQERVHGELSHVSTPVLLVHRDGRMAQDPEDVRYVLERLGTVHKRIEWLDSGSAPAPEEERESRLAQAVFTFVRNYLQ
ncbi:MAG: AI-2E family transporter [Anaerolineae bacterium]